MLSLLLVFRKHTIIMRVIILSVIGGIEDREEKLRGNRGGLCPYKRT